MKIAINSLGVNGGGGKTYLEQLLPALQKIDKVTQYFILIRTSALSSVPDCGPQFCYIPVEPPSELAGRLIKEQVWLPNWLRKEKINLLFSPADSTSLLAPCPIVLAMRNMNLYVRREKGWALSYQLRFRGLSTLARLSAKIANKIIFVSRFSQKLISDSLDIPFEKQRLVYHGVSSNFLQSAKIIPKELEWLKSRTPYILSVSSIYRYKNYVRLIEAFNHYRQKISQDYHLIIAGSPFDKPYYKEILKAIHDLKLQSSVYLANEVAYHHLPYLYQSSACFVFPSYLETFGHPLVEAMASGVPIAAAGIDNSREICGEAARYFDPYDPHNIAQVLEEVTQTPSIQSELVKKSKEQVAQFSWDKCASETLAVFKEILSI